MNRTTQVELTNMCMIYDNSNNILVARKILNSSSGLIFPCGHVESNESITDSVICEIKEETRLTIAAFNFVE